MTRIDREPLALQRCQGLDQQRRLLTDCRIQIDQDLAHRTGTSHPLPEQGSLACAVEPFEDGERGAGIQLVQQSSSDNLAQRHLP